MIDLFVKNGSKNEEIEMFQACRTLGQALTYSRDKMSMEVSSCIMYSVLVRTIRKHICFIILLKQEICKFLVTVYSLLTKDAESN